VFTPEEVIHILGEDEGKAFCIAYDITQSGNFEGKSIPNLVRNRNYENEYKNQEAVFDRLYQYRLRRTKLHKDDKILTSWNALMIAALARAYFVFGNRDCLEAAVKA
jgi:uncharacterized protein YyaL (SSP411 family)